MKAYNENLLKNKWVQQVVQEWTETNLLTKEKGDEIQKEYAQLPYQPHWFVWIGLFIFTIICISSGSILFIPFVDVAGAENYLLPLYGIVLFFFLNYLIRERKLHFSGIDNALLYSILLSFSMLILEISSAFGDAPWIYALCYMPLLLVANYRYGEPVIALGTLLNGLFILAAIAMEFSWGKLLLPFIVMLYAGIAWLVIHWFMKKETSFYWKTALHWVHIASLVLFYLAGNYGIVREGNAMINSIFGPSPEIAFAPFFWFFTFTVPVLYIYAALRWKSLTFLTIGSLAGVFSLITLHHYYPIIPGEWAMTLLGALFIGLAIYFMRLLKTPKRGFAYTPEKKSELGVLAENIIAMQVSGDLPQQPDGTPFGGGDFGGGGSGDGY